jgi:RNA polymerase sigma-70 factor (ECF subfamily)
MALEADVPQSLAQKAVAFGGKRESAAGDGALREASEPDDDQLARAAAAGDNAAFRRLVDRHAQKLFRSAMALSRNRADAEDLLQDTLVAVHRGLKNFAGRSSVRTWMSTILTRQAFKSLHRARHRRATLSLDGMSDGSPAATDHALVVESAGKVERRIDVMEVLRSLSDQHREVLVLREIQGLSYEEIAAALGVPRGTVESRLFRARAEFRQRFSRTD